MVLTRTMPWLLKTDYNLLLNSCMKYIMQEMVEYCVFSATCKAVSDLVPACFKKLPFLLCLAFSLDQLGIWLAVRGGKVQMIKWSLQESLYFGIFLPSIRALTDLDGYSLCGKREKLSGSIYFVSPFHEYYSKAPLWVWWTSFWSFLRPRYSQANQIPS